MTEKELDRFVKRMDKRIARARKAGTIKRYTAIWKLTLQIDLSQPFRAAVHRFRKHADARSPVLSTPHATAPAHHICIRASVFAGCDEIILNVV